MSLLGGTLASLRKVNMTDEVSPPTAPPGWYPTSDGLGTRWWNGTSWATPPVEDGPSGNAGLAALAAARSSQPSRTEQASPSTRTSAPTAALGAQPDVSRGGSSRWLVAAVVVVALIAAGIVVFRTAGEGQGDGTDMAWEIAWQEQTMTQKTEVTGCQQYTSFGRCFVPEYSHEQVPGPTATRRSTVCAPNRDMADELAADLGRERGVIAEVVAGPLEPNTCEDEAVESPAPTRAATRPSAPTPPASPAAPVAIPARAERYAGDLAIAVNLCYDMTLRYPATLEDTKTCDSSQRYFRPLPSSLRVACWNSTGSALTFVIWQPSTNGNARYDSTAGEITTDPEGC